MSWSSSALREPNKRHENVGDKLKRTQKLCWQSLKKYFIRFKSGLWRRSRCGTLLENICDGLKGHKMVLLGFLVEINGTRLLFIQDDSQESRKIEKHIPYYQSDILFQLKEVLLQFRVSFFTVLKTLSDESFILLTPRMYFYKK